MKRFVPRRSAVARLPRRAVLVGLAAGVSCGLAVSARGEDEPEKPGSDDRPRPGDVLVFAEDEHAGQPVKPADLSGATLTPVWPMDPASRVVRDGSRLNALLLLRLDPQELDVETRSASADGGIVAYSAICAHAGCPVTGFLEEQGQQVLKCFCHGSAYDPRRQGAVVSGPAPRRLAGLPIEIADGQLVVKATFNGKVGPTQSG
jgi:rieske iron-sulfur protein